MKVDGGGDSGEKASIVMDSPCERTSTESPVRQIAPRDCGAVLAAVHVNHDDGEQNQAE
jgi:hypothetical protein